MSTRLIGITPDGRLRYAADYIVPPPAPAGDDGDPAINDQVDQGTDDGEEKESDGSMSIAVTTVLVQSDVTTRYWGAFRFRSPTGVDADPDAWPVQGSTIDVAYTTVYLYILTFDDANLDIYAEDAASPPTLTADAFNITNRTLTDASAPWVANGIGVGWAQSPSIVNVIQELVTDYNITTVMLVFKPRSDAYKAIKPYSYEEADNTWGAKLYLEWTAPVGGGIGGGAIYGEGSLAPLGAIGGGS